MLLLNQITLPLTRSLKLPLPLILILIQFQIFILILINFIKMKMMVIMFVAVLMTCIAVSSAYRMSSLKMMSRTTNGQGKIYETILDTIGNW